MKYINKNQIEKFLVEETEPNPKEWYMKTAYEITIEFVGGTLVFLEKKTKAECIALAEKLGLTLIE